MKTRRCWEILFIHWTDSSYVHVVVVKNFQYRLAWEVHAQLSAEN